MKDHRESNGTVPNDVAYVDYLLMHIYKFIFPPPFRISESDLRNLMNIGIIKRKFLEVFGGLR